MSAKRYKEFTNWDWEVTVAALRYYECGHTIASGMFPAEFVKRFFTGDYDPVVCERFAYQYANTDHDLRKEKDFQQYDEDQKIWYVPTDNHPWLVLYDFCEAYANGNFHTVETKYYDENRKCDVIGWQKAFYCKALDQWYPVDKYLSNPHITWTIIPETIQQVGPAKRFDEE